MNSFKTIKVDSANHATTISFVRQQTLNSITLEFMDELGEAFRLISADSECRALILTGTGRGFCSGLDLNLLGQIGNSIPVEEVRGIIQHWQDVLNRLENLPQVTLAAINGLTLGGGVEMALACDFRHASTRALFGIPEVKLGIIPDLGGITRLTRAIGPARTKEIVLRARNFSAMEALRVGLVHRVSEPGDLMGLACSWAEQFTKLPPPAVQHAKRLINTVFDGDLTTGLEAAENAQMELLASEEFRQALLAAREERVAEPAE